MFFTPYNFTSIFLTVKGPASQETVLVLFHRRYPTIAILLSSKIPSVLSDCVMFMWPFTIHVLCMTHESTATPFCVNKDLYIYIYICNSKCVASTHRLYHAKTSRGNTYHAMALTSPNQMCFHEINICVERKWHQICDESIDLWYVTTFTKTHVARKCYNSP